MLRPTVQMAFESVSSFQYLMLKIHNKKTNLALEKNVGLQFSNPENPDGHWNIFGLFWALDVCNDACATWHCKYCNYFNDSMICFEKGVTMLVTAWSTENFLVLCVLKSNLLWYSWFQMQFACHYSPITFDDRLTFWFQRARPLPCACAYVA